MAHLKSSTVWHHTSHAMLYSLTLMYTPYVVQRVWRTSFPRFPQSVQAFAYKISQLDHYSLFDVLFNSLFTNYSIIWHFLIWGTAGPSGRAVYCRSPAEIVGSNPTGGMDVCLSVCCECCVLSGRGLCDDLITRPDESYRLWCVVVCDLEKQTSWMRRPRPTMGLSRQKKTWGIETVVK